MTHNEALALIRREFEQGALPEASRQAMRAHLRECTACRQAYDAFAEAELAIDPDGADDAVVDRLWPAVRDEAAAPTPAPRGSQRRWLHLVAPVAAAAVALFMLRPAPRGLPDYGLEMTPAIPAAVRGSDASTSGAPPVLFGDGELVFVLRPERAHAVAVDARAFRVRGGRAILIEAEPQRSGEGAVRLSTLGSVALPELGRWRIAVVVGAKGALPSASEVAKVSEGLADGRTEGPSWTLWLQTIERR